MKIFYHELENNLLIYENQQLRGQERKAEWDLAAEQAKRLKIEQKLQVVVRDSENRKEQYKEKFKRLAKKSRKNAKTGTKRSKQKETFH